MNLRMISGEPGEATCVGTVRHACQRQRPGLSGVILLSMVGWMFASSPAHSQASPTTQTEQSKLTRAPDALGVLGPDLFGDVLNFYDGSLQFLQEDVSIPGNNKLPVRVARKLEAGSRNEGNHMFQEWELDMPYISGTFSEKNGWQRAVGGTPSNQRCSNFGAPPDVADPRDIWKAFEFWHGNFLYVPGAGKQEILKRNPVNQTIPEDGTATPLVTKNNWAVRCLTSLASPSGSSAKEAGEGFLAIAPDGTQYRFDWLISRSMITLTKPSNVQDNPSSLNLVGAAVTKNSHPQQPLPQGVKQILRVEAVARPPTTNGSGGTVMKSLLREEVRILPTLVTDRFGNTVRYNYDPSMKNRLLSIVSSDGRSLTFTHEAGTNVITSASDGTRTWQYTYGVVDSGRTMLTEVTLPDSSKWQLGGLDGGRDKDNLPGLEGLVQMNIEYLPDEFNMPWCDQPGVNLHGHTATGTMVHPSGATGKFTMKPTRHGRNGVPLGCYANGTPFAAPYYPAYIDSYSMTEKSISGPGLPTMTWSNNYDGTDVGAWSSCGAACIQPAVVLATDPKGNVTRYVFGATFAVDEGMLKQVDVGWDGSGALRSTKTQYNRSFTAPVGFSDQDRGDNWVTTHRLPPNQRLITQQGLTFSWQVPDGAFDRFARPSQVVRSSSLGARTEKTLYADNLSKWVLGQVAKITEANTGLEMVSNTYNASTANLEAISHFGHPQVSMTYNADGTLLTKQDGNNFKTTYSNYKRGIAQHISYPDGTTESALVNDYGAVTQHTDQNNYVTKYAPDAIGRLKSIIYPSSDTVAWNPTTVTYQQVQGWEFDLAPGHWRQDITTGNALTRTYYDAMWRPAYSEKMDAGDPGATSGIIKRSYDFNGRALFESYPKRTHADIGDGVTHEYDALGRHTSSIAASDPQSILTTSVYNSGFTKSTTDGRGKITTFGYQAFDEPTEAAIANIVAPAGVSVVIARDLFGKPTSITRSGGGKSATRSYVYDQYQRLCKTVDPETAATVLDYDGANNVLWRAAGLRLPATTPCETASVAPASKITFGYDPLNRLKATTFGDGSPGIARTFTADGLPATITSNGAVWTNIYNNRRLNERESLAYGGATYNIDRTYDPNGSLSQLRYPDGATISYNPNALGEPRQAGAYARAVTYHPSGAIASLTYGNGITHSMTQNRRGLPWQSVDNGVISDEYSYDANANVTGIADKMPTSVSSRTMGYDDLDRLTSVSSPALWGNATYGYDALDNLTTSAIGGGATARSIVHTFDPATNRLTRTSGGPAAYNFSYGYDTQGNITQRGAQGYVFDQGNRMKSATGKATYGYDGLGHRFTVVGTDGANRVQVYSQEGQLLYVRSTAVPLAAGTRYIYLHRHQVAEVKAAGAN